MVFFYITADCHLLCQRKYIVGHIILRPLNNLNCFTLSVITLNIYSIAQIAIKVQIALKQRILVMASAYLQIEQAKNFINLRIRGVLCIFYKLSKNFWNNWKIIGILLISKILIATVIVEEINNTILSYAF